MNAALDAGAEDVITDSDGAIEVVCSPNDFQAIKSALEKSGLKPEVAEVTMRASTETELIGDDGVKMQKLLDAIESLDDVQEVYTNAVIQ
jgi:transcriptional/translational regulatory protein YebC/TACO1